MKLIEMKCPNCGAPVHVSAEARTGVCDYCKSEFFVESGEQTGYEFEKGRMRAKEEARKLEEQQRQAVQEQLEAAQQAIIEEAKNRKGMSFEAVAGIILAFAGIILVIALKSALTSLLVTLAIIAVEAVFIVRLIRKKRWYAGHKDDIISVIVISILIVLMVVMWIV